MISKETASTLLNGIVYGAYIGLLTATPTYDSNGVMTNVVEPEGNGYSRESINQRFSTNAFVTDHFEISNLYQIKFDKATGTWGTIVAFGIFSSATGGTPKYVGTLTSQPTISAGQSVNIGVGQAVLKVY